MTTIQDEIAQLMRDAEELKEIKEKKKQYMRDYCRERKRKLKAQSLGISYDEYVAMYLPKANVLKKPMTV